MNESTKNVFVTGGSGFVGRHFIPKLIEKGYQVKALARSIKSGDLLAGLGAEVVKGDLNDEQAIRLGVQNCVTVFHLAASVDFHASESDLTRVHVKASELLIREAKGAGVRNFIYLGAASVIINGQPIRSANESFVSDNMTDGYSITKLKAEKLILNAAFENFRTISLRPPLIWGRNDPSALPSIVDAIKKRQLMFINGGEHYFSTCHVQNVCHALMLAESSGQSGESYFITDDDDQNFKSFIKSYVAGRVKKVPDKSISLKMARIFASSLEFVWRVFRLKNSPPLYNGLVNVLGLPFTLDISKAKNELDYEPIISVEQGLREMK